MTSLKTELVTYRASARAFTGKLVFDEGQAAAAPGILVCHGGAGPGDHELHVAQRLARTGYAALVADLFGETFTSREHGVAVIQALVSNPDELLARAQAAVNGLATHSAVDGRRLGAVGYCFGGLVVLELARAGTELAAVVSVHGSLLPRGSTSGPIRARILICTGAADPFAGRDDREAFEDEMTGRGADWQVLLISGAQHGFADEGAPARVGVAFDPRAADRAWRATRSHFAECLV